MRVNTVFSSEQGFEEHDAVEPTIERDLISIDKPLKFRCVVAVELRSVLVSGPAVHSSPSVGSHDTHTEKPTGKHTGRVDNIEGALHWIYGFTFI